MADKSIGSLPPITDLDDASLLVVEQQGAAGKLTGAQFKEFAKVGVEQYVEDAQSAAQEALAASQQALEAVSQIGTSVDEAQTAATEAEAAQQAIENMTVSSETLTAGSSATVTKTTTAGVVNLLFGLPTGESGPTGPAGSSIQSITRTSGTGAPGTTDTYTITLTDGSTSTFQVYNGQDGLGSGDMTKIVYDPQEKAQDIFSYTENILSEHEVADTAHQELFATKQDAITVSGLLKGNGTTVAQAVAGADYVATESDPTVPTWAKAENKPTYTAAEVGAEATGAVATHNTAGDAHASLFAAKADLVDGKVPESQLPQSGGGSNVVVGTYVGNAASSSETPQTINLGGQPLFVWVGSLDNYVSNDPGVPWYEDTYFYEGGTEEESLKRLYSAYAYWGDPYYWVNSAGELSAVLEITSTGFDVYNYDYVNEGTSRYKTYRARLNMNNDTYFYLAVMEG